jgi:hypothetical protein
VSTITPSPTVAVQPRRVGMILTALVALVAVAATALVIALSGTSSSHPATHQASGTFAPLIQYHGTGAAPSASTAGAAVHASGPAYIRAEHSYGMVP